jgi:hypothetical protein
MMDIEFEHAMRKLLYAHMEDATNYFLEHKTHPLRVFVYTGYEYEHFCVDPLEYDAVMKNVQEKAWRKEATAVSLVGMMKLSRYSRDSEKPEQFELNDVDEQTVLAVILRLLDGKSFSLMSEILEEDGEIMLDELVELDGSQMKDIPIKPWGN